MSNYMSHSKKI